MGGQDYSSGGFEAEGEFPLVKGVFGEAWETSRFPRGEFSKWISSSKWIQSSMESVTASPEKQLSLFHDAALAGKAQCQH